uniref:DENN domain-containing protein 3-like n=1 Tax=Salarias fasciatus TaxID=181472 RepID=A0A672FWG1_SALFA
NGSQEHLLLEPEILHVFVPPFVSKSQPEGESLRSRGRRRRSFMRKKRQQPPSAAPIQGGLQVTNERKDEQFHFLVFTDVFGNKTYGVVMQRYCPLLDWTSFYKNGAGSSPCVKLFSACGFCVISKYPYFTALKDCLSCLLMQLKVCRLSDMEERVREFAAKLALVPVPPPGQLHLMFTLPPLSITLPCSEDKNHPTLDLDLHLPFICFRPQQLLQVLSCLLQEQRVVLFSADWSRLTLVAESLLAFLQPLSWQQPYVPVLARGMLDFLMAPTAFLMGCHVNHFADVAAETDDLILISIDNGSVSCSSSDNINLPDIPQAAADCFTQRCQSLQIHFDLNQCHKASCTDINEQRAQRRAWQQNLNYDIQTITLELIVNIFRDVGSHLNYEHRVFHSEEFLKTRDPSEQLFYKKVLDTHIFHSFLRDRLNKKMDSFARMELSTRSEMQKLVVSTASPDLWIEPVEVFKLPDFPTYLSFHSVQAYYSDLIQQLGKSIFSAQNESSALLARFYYMRGLINTLCSRRLDALSDFQNLNKTDTAIFPTNLVTWLVESLQQEERNLAQKRPELKRLIFRVSYNEKPPVEPDNSVKKFKLPLKHLYQDEFVRCIQECGIVKNVETIHRLFDALTDGQPRQVKPELFKDFYSFWKEMEAESHDADLPSEVVEHLDNSECVYKLSSCVKTSHGVGKIAMTQKRLFLLTEGRPDFLEITKFRDIQDVKIASAPFLLVRIPSLRIQTSSRSETFEANLKAETELWNIMVKEMWAGRRLADQHKDPQYLTQALTNVLLMDAVMGCLPAPRPITAASKLVHFDKLIHEVPMMVPEATSETLKHKINPSQDLPKPQTVHVLLYTPGSGSAASQCGMDMNPKLWVALSGGKVVVFDAASWSMLQDRIQVGESQVNCMMGLVQDHVWIGSQDSVIYIIDTHSMSCNKQLTEHRHEVTAVMMAYSCSSDGTVLQWDSSSLKVKRQYSVSCDRLSSIQIHSGTLWCCKCTLPPCICRFLPNNFLHFTDEIPSLYLSIYSPRVLCLLQRGQVWTGCSDSPELCLWWTNNSKQPFRRISLPSSAGVTCMIRVKDQIWVGCRGWSCVGGQCDGQQRSQVVVLDPESHSVDKELQAHSDCIQTLCSAEDRYVLSGSASRDGKIAIWKVE